MAKSLILQSKKLLFWQQICWVPEHDQSTSISTVLFFNAQSVSGKVHDLHNFIFSRPIVPFVIGVVETWFNSSIPNECLNVPAYSVLRCDRPTQGGGIMLLIKDDCHILSSNHVCFGPVQVLYVDIECTSLSSEVARFVCIYRPPNADMVNSLLLIDALEKTNCSCK